MQDLLSELTGAIDSRAVSNLTQVCDVAQRRLAKKTAVLAAELGGALIAYLANMEGVNPQLQSLIISHGGIGIFVTRPLALTALLIALLFLAFPLIPAIRARRAKLAE